MKKILVTMQVDDEQRNLLESQAKTTEFPCEFIYKSNSELKPEDLSEIDWLIGSPPPEILVYAKKLEWLQIIFAGADAYMKISPQIKITSASGAYDVAVAEHLLALTLALTRKIDKYVRQQEKHIWKRTRAIKSIKNSTVLILGAGNIGSEYAKMVKTMGAYVIGVSRSKKNKRENFDEQYTVEELDKILDRADIIAMILPGGEQTAHFMDEKRLSAVKKGAYLINVGRGNAIEPNSLKKLLREGHFGGIALDVTEPEPLPADDELWGFENVIITPHCAGGLYLKETRDEIIKICAENLLNKIRNKPLKNEVNRALGY